jgi:DNA-directed RNA polymerase specialized sigma24 family protein
VTEEDAGHPQAGADFTEFVRDTRPKYLWAAMAQGSSPHDAEDAVQIAHLGVLKVWPQITTREGSLVTYGRTAVSNAVKDQGRRTRRLPQPCPPEDLPEGMSNLGIPDAPYVSACACDGVYERIIDELIPALPKRQRDVVTLCILRDHTPAEGAAGTEGRHGEAVPEGGSEQAAEHGQ